MSNPTLRKLTSGSFAAVLIVGTLSWSCPARAQYDDHERHERERRIDECIEGKRHHIHELEERREISREEADRMRDHSHEECEREVRERG